MRIILIVSDDENILNMVQHILTSQGFDVKTHSTGLNVPDIIMHYHPNIILLERSLAGKLGTEVCIELNQMHIHLSIILFSAQIEQENSFDLCDGDEFIQKPFEIKNLIDTINLNLN
jgi:two-component system response regulator VicR